ncbi:MAG: hypothetical protein AB7U38_04910 [Hyphomicrobiales bacterium]
MIFRLFAAALAAMMLAGPVHAGEVQELATKAEAEVGSGKGADAITTMRDALLTVWDKSPLTFTNAFTVQEKANGFGLYKRRADGPYQLKEPILIYAEPVGFGWRKEGELYNSDMVADFVLHNAEGKVLGGQKEFGNFKVSSHVRNTEYFINLRYNLTGLPAGKYVIVSTIRDLVAGKSGSFETPFEIR